jgi:hypothetical protein
MNQVLKVSVGVGGGYVLGRRKKLKLAVGLGAWLLGKKIKLDPQALLAEGLQKLAQNPDVMKLSDEVRGQLLVAARTAATKGLSDQVNALAGSLNRQAELARQPAGAVGDTVDGAVSGEDDSESEDEESASYVDDVAAAGEDADGPRADADDSDADNSDTDDSDADDSDADDSDAAESNGNGRASRGRSRAGSTKSSTPRATRGSRTSERNGDSGKDDRPRERSGRKTAASNGGTTRTRRTREPADEAPRPRRRATSTEAKSSGDAAPKRRSRSRTSAKS